MNQTLLILDSDGADWSPSSLPAGRLRGCFLYDTLALADRLPNTSSMVVGPGSVYAALSYALASGPAILLTADVPHLPIWRLRDAFTHLRAGAKLVIGPAEHSGWYLLGLSPAGAALLPALSTAGLDGVAAVSHAEPLTLPAWYRLRSHADLQRLAIDLGPMPAGVASHTRALLNEDGLQARAVGA